MMELDGYLKKTYQPEEEEQAEYDPDAPPPTLLMCQLERCKQLVTLVSPIFPSLNISSLPWRNL